MALLRWALGSPHPDLAVEAALALEDIGATFDARAGRQPGGAGAGGRLRRGAGGGGAATDAVEAGLADAPLVPALAREARGYSARR